VPYPDLHPSSACNALLVLACITVAAEAKHVQHGLARGKDGSLDTKKRAEPWSQEQIQLDPHLHIPSMLLYDRWQIQVRVQI